MTTVILAPAHAARDILEARQVQLGQPSFNQVAIIVRAVGLNPTDWKSADRSWPRTEPMVLGFEAAGQVSALGSAAAASGLQVGDAVIAYPVIGAYASHLLVPAGDLHRKPDTLDFPQAANLLLAGTTAAEMLHRAHIGSGDTVVVHGASGATGVSALQQLRPLGAQVVATAGGHSFPLVHSLGATPVAYGPGLTDRLRAAAPSGYTAALDCVGAEEALQSSRDVVIDRARIITIANKQRATELGITFIDGNDPASFAYRNAQRQRLVDLAAAGSSPSPSRRHSRSPRPSMRSRCCAPPIPAASWR